MDSFGLINEVKRKREFSKLPDSLVHRALECSKGDVKEARFLLRKYLGVFLTNKVIKGVSEEVLGFHLSSKKRDYAELYSRIFEDLKEVGTIVDIGCGVNSFSYPFLKQLLGEVTYVGLEASGQLVDSSNAYFGSHTLSGKAIQCDLFELSEVVRVLRTQRRPCVVFMFQIIDALEFFEKDYSKTFIQTISGYVDRMVISLPLVSLSGRTTFDVQRMWLLDFLREHFSIEKDFKAFGERFIIFKNLLSP